MGRGGEGQILDFLTNHMFLRLYFQTAVPSSKNGFSEPKVCIVLKMSLSYDSKELDLTQVQG